MDTSDPLAVLRATVHAQLLIQRYPLNTSHTSKQRLAPCPCCLQCEETLEHFLIHCPGLSMVRDRYLPAMTRLLLELSIEPTDPNLLQAALDPSALSPDPEFISATLQVARSLCFHLHSRRSSQSDITRPKNLRSATIHRRGNILTYREPTCKAATGCVQTRGTGTQD